MITLDDDLKAYSDTADVLRNSFERAGHYAMTQLHIGCTLATAIIFVAGDPADVRAVMEGQHLRPVLNDLHYPDAGAPLATWNVRFAGHDIAVVADPRRIPAAASLTDAAA